MQKPPKIPELVLVVIHTPDLDVLIIERADREGFWQSVTGSKDRLDEPVAETAAREVMKETGIEIGGPLVPHCMEVTLAPREHTAHLWLPFREAVDRCFSSSNREAILQLPERFAAHSR